MSRKRAEDDEAEVLRVEPHPVLDGKLFSALRGGGRVRSGKTPSTVSGVEGGRSAVVLVVLLLFFCCLSRGIQLGNVYIVIILNIHNA